MICCFGGPRCAVPQMVRAWNEDLGVQRVFSRIQERSLSDVSGLCVFCMHSSNRNSNTKRKQEERQSYTPEERKRQRDSNTHNKRVLRGLGDFFSATLCFMHSGPYIKK